MSTLHNIEEVLLILGQFKDSTSLFTVLDAQDSKKTSAVRQKNNLAILQQAVRDWETGDVNDKSFNFTSRNITIKEMNSVKENILPFYFILDNGSMLT